MSKYNVSDVSPQLRDEKNGKKNLKFLRSTIMNPFQSSNEFVARIASTFRNTVLNCVAKVTAFFISKYVTSVVGNFIR